MLPERLQDLAWNGVGLDTETCLIRQGNLTPDIVLGSAGFWDPELGGVDGMLLDKQSVLELFATLIDDKSKTLLTANGPFDLGVIAREYAKLEIDVMPQIFQSLMGDYGEKMPFETDGRVYDCLHAQALDAIGNGHLNKDPRTGQELKDGRYNLNNIVRLLFDEDTAKEDDEYRKSYDQFMDVPLDQLPEKAARYPVTDAKNHARAPLAQTGFLPKHLPHHTWGAHGKCESCGATGIGGRCVARQPHVNLHDLAHQTGTAWVLHLGATWGFRVDQKQVDIIWDHAERDREDGLKPFIADGLIRSDGSENRSELKRRIAVAYGAEGVCQVCQGTGKVPSPKNPKSKIVCFTMASDGVTKEKTCDGTGLVLHNGIPRSEKEGISYGMDTLNESGDEGLVAYAHVQEKRKYLITYIPYLRRGRVCISCEGPKGEGAHGTEKFPHSEGCAMAGWKDIPLTLKPNPILDTGRVSYSDPSQTFPRKKGYFDKKTQIYVPSLRETIIAMPGTVLSSEDFDSGELITHGFNCLVTVGESKLARALNTGVKPHNDFAAKMLGMSYPEFQRKFKEGDLLCKNTRQAAKPANFGFPGGMGPVKLVHQQRKQGPNTPCDQGPMDVEDEDGNIVRGYKGLRFCILMNGAPRCGRTMVREWKDRPITPTCLECIECSVRLKQQWLEQWPENKKYLNRFVNECVEYGQTIEPHLLARWPWLRRYYRPGQQLEPGQIMQHVSGRLRGGLDYCALANGFFQGLLGDIAKSALRRVGRECYDSTVRVPSHARHNSRLSRYAGAISPLYGSKPIMFAHDELICQHPESVAPDAAERVSEIMVEEMMFYCPELAPACKAEPTLMRAWRKDASCVRNKNKPRYTGDTEGTLEVWQPKKIAA